MFVKSSFGQRKINLDKQIKQLSQTERYKDNISLLLSVPSIGITSAMIFLTEIGDIKRFERFDELCSFFGLIPNCHSSGDNERVGHITRRGNQIFKVNTGRMRLGCCKKRPCIVAML